MAYRLFRGLDFWAKKVSSYTPFSHIIYHVIGKRAQPNMNIHKCYTWATITYMSANKQPLNVTYMSVNKTTGWSDHHCYAEWFI